MKIPTCERNNMVSLCYWTFLPFSTASQWSKNRGIRHSTESGGFAFVTWVCKGEAPLVVHKRALAARRQSATDPWQNERKREPIMFEKLTAMPLNKVRFWNYVLRCHVGSERRTGHKHVLALPCHWLQGPFILWKQNTEVWNHIWSTLQVYEWLRKRAYLCEKRGMNPIQKVTDGMPVWKHYTALSILFGREPSTGR